MGTNVGCFFLFLLLPNIIVVLYIASSFGLCCFTCGFVLSYFAIVGFTVFWNFWFCFVLFFNFDDNSQPYFHKLFSVFLVLFCFVIFCYYFFILLLFHNLTARLQSFFAAKKPGEDSHMKQTGMLVVSLRGVNFGFWSRLGCSGQSANILSRQGLV